MRYGAHRRERLFSSGAARAALLLQVAASLACARPLTTDPGSRAGGRSRLEGTSRDDAITGGVGDDEVHARDGDDTVRGGAGDDRLFGGDGDDLLRGEADADVLVGGPGADRLVGGSGADLFVVSAREETGRIDTIADFKPREGDRILIEGWRGPLDPEALKLQPQQGGKTLLVRDATRWRPVVRFSVMEISLAELVRRRAIVPRLSIRF